MGLSIGGRPHRTASASASSNSESLSASGTMAGRGKVAAATGRPYLWGSGEAEGGSGCAEGLEGVEGVATVGPGVLDRPPGICASGRSTLAHGSCTLVGACHDTIWGHPKMGSLVGWSCRGWKRPPAATPTRIKSRREEAFNVRPGPASAMQPPPAAPLPPTPKCSHVSPSIELGPSHRFPSCLVCSSCVAGPSVGGASARRSGCHAAVLEQVLEPRGGAAGGGAAVGTAVAPAHRSAGGTAWDKGTLFAVSLAKKAWPGLRHCAL